MSHPRHPIRIIGAGPGDPDLLTLKALRYLKKADVVYHDRLVHDVVLALANPASRKVCVGHRAGVPGPAPRDVVRQMARDYHRSLRVVRLKAGDPLVFARYVEEADELASLGIPYEIVPGVSSATAVPASAGIPLTVRDLSSGFTVECGTRNGGKVGIPAFCMKGASLTRVFLMPGRRLEPLVEELYQQGYPPETPAAIIAWGTTPRHTVVHGSLRDILSRQEEIPASYPKILVVGQAVSLRKSAHPENAKTFAGSIVIPWLHGLGEPPWRYWWKKGFDPSPWVPGRIVIEERSFERLRQWIKNHRRVVVIVSSLTTARLLIRGFRVTGFDVRHLKNICLVARGRVRSYLWKHGLITETLPVIPDRTVVVFPINPVEARPEPLRTDLLLPVARIELNEPVPSLPDADWIDGRYPGLLRLVKNLFNPTLVERLKVLVPRRFRNNRFHFPVIPPVPGWPIDISNPIPGKKSRLNGGTE